MCLELDECTFGLVIPFLSHTKGTVTFTLVHLLFDFPGWYMGLVTPRQIARHVGVACWAMPSFGPSPRLEGKFA